MPFDPSALAGRDVRGLRSSLLESGYRTDAVARLLGLPDAESLLTDIARHSLIRCELLDDSCPAVLGKLFLLCAPVPAAVFGGLPRALTRELRENGLVRFDTDAGIVTGTVTITEFDGYFYLADRLFENSSGRITVGCLDTACMPPHASSFEIMRAIGPVRSDSVVLDVGCGSGFLSVPLARAAGHLTGIDINERAAAFARANATLNDVPACFGAGSWEDFEAGQRFSRVIFNAPNAPVGFGFISGGVPRLLAPGGVAQVWAMCEVLAEDGDIHGTVDRMCTLAAPLRLTVVRNEDSLFSLGRDAITSGKRPRHTLLIDHPAQWRAYVDDLRSRTVTEVVSATLEIRSLS